MVVGGSKVSAVGTKTTGGTGTTAATTPTTTGQVGGGVKKPVTASSVPKINFTGTGEHSTETLG